MSIVLFGSTFARVLGAWTWSPQVARHCSPCRPLAHPLCSAQQGYLSTSHCSNHAKAALSFLQGLSLAALCMSQSGIAYVRSHKLGHSRCSCYRPSHTSKEGSCLVEEASRCGIWLWWPLGILQEHTTAGSCWGACGCRHCYPVSCKDLCITGDVQCILLVCYQLRSVCYSFKVLLCYMPCLLLKRYCVFQCARNVRLGLGCVYLATL